MKDALVTAAIFLFEIEGDESAIAAIPNMILSLAKYHAAQCRQR